MSNRIADAFASGKAFIPFITCGDPQIGVTEKLIEAMAGEGADLIELGIPFSDPTAEGPVIQGANVRALSGGVTTDDVLSMAARLRKKMDIPFVVMTYANVVFSYGIRRFACRARECGIDGVILPDVPFEEREEFAPDLEAEGLALISMIAPTSQDRIRRIASASKGFIYIVSSLGVTGMRRRIESDIDRMTKEVRSVTDTPCAVGFGISSPEQAKEMAALADGVIVGSAIVSMIGKKGEGAVDDVAAFVRSMKEAIRQEPAVQKKKVRL